ncbi:Pun1p KNAG_0B06320 [Huiozyma naganishii CBS 8797]|uniref:Uncharacterized protein n=1 Tax=Huiozyma naganishii (strain ATCC MYA-139 / BCRC 22969 / CBS 8797 / KCTC 17520 / NBRC 10181 / NCYC 3082 / Yp74L-3) TaxID=1071383 RepID=J7S5C4_HUIN7|nr:hypothetical protein KNAG_0B06320 [Kazachstania naganishii CBS 8797]CCK69061.1 hypothetical protein KNAG_0B06320 [Kazachstania naganishii CBS 8797]
MSNVFRLLFTAIFALAALVLAIVACAGSTKNYYPINQIYVAQLSLKEAALSALIPTLASVTNSEVQLPSAINLGLWSYCLESSSGSIESCTSPKGIQQFNLKDMIYDNIENNTLLQALDASAVVLPTSVQDKLTYINNIIKCTFITLLIGIALTFLNLVFCLIRWIIHIRVFKWLGVFCSFFGFISLLISMGCATGVFVFVKHTLDKDYSQYGIELNLGRNFMGIAWGAVAAALFNLITWLSVRSANRARVVYAQDPLEKKPFM